MNPQLLQYAPHGALMLYALAMLTNALCRLLADRRDYAFILRVWKDTGDLVAVDAYVEIVRARRNRKPFSQPLSIRARRLASGDADSRPPP